MQRLVSIGVCVQDRSTRQTHTRLLKGYRHRNDRVVLLIYRYNGLPTEHRSTFGDGLRTEEPLLIVTLFRIKRINWWPRVLDLQLEFAVPAA